MRALLFPRATRTLASSLALAAIVLHSAPALAGDEAAAEALFLDGKKLAAEGKLAEACPKFAESNRLDRGAGTLIHLADCYEKNRQTASAWATFKEAASAAQALGRADWQKLAAARAAALEPKLARLTIKVQEPAEKTEVTRDGSLTSAASWGTPLPVDLGAHTVQASAPGRKPFKVTVAIAKDGERVEVVVPKLDRAYPGAPAVAPLAQQAAAGGEAEAGASNGSVQRTTGLVMAGVGVLGLGLGLGAVTGLVAMGKNSASKQTCPNDGACASTDAVDANESARTFGAISTTGFVAGGAMVAIGAVVYFTAPRANASSTTATARPGSATGVRVVPASDGRSAGMTVMGVF